MASISSTLRLNDGMTPVMRKINQVMGIMINNFETSQRLSGQAIDTKAIASARAGLNEVDSVLDRMEENQQRFNDSVGDGSSKVDSLLGKLKGVVATYASIQGASKLIGLSDTQTQTNARLRLMVDDNNTVESLEQKIFESAERSRGLYQTTADAVSKLGMQAGKAFNNNNDEVIRFTELLNKQFVVAGTSAQGVDSVMLQITQAMAAGKLQGEELNAILDNAQPIVSNIQRYLQETQNIDASNIKELASQGVLTADVIKNAMFYCADDIDKQFNKMPMTWSQVWNSMQNYGLQALKPLLTMINNLANNEKVVKSLKSTMSVFSKIISVVTKIVSALFDYKEYLLIVAAAMTLYFLPVLQAKIAALVKSAIAWAAQNWQLLLFVAVAATAVTIMNALGLSFEWIAIAIAGVVLAYAAWQVAQWALNGAAYACPILAIIMAVIAAIVILVILFKKFTKEIVGGLFVAGVFFKNIGLWCANLGLAIWSVIKNIGLWFANLALSIWTVIKNIGLWFGNLGQTIWSIIKNVGLWFANLGLGIWNVMKAAASNVATAFSNGWINIQIGFWSMLNVIMQGLTSLAEMANKVLGWMGVNIDTSGLDFAADKIDELNAKKSEYTDVGQAWQEGFSTFAYDDLAKSWTTYGYDSVSSAMNTFAYDDVAKSFGTFDIFEKGWASSAYASGSAAGAGIQNWMNENLTMDKALGALGLDGSGGLGGNVESIADDTSDISDSVSKSNEELAYLRDIAEREAINRFTTAEVKLDFSGMTNRIDSEMDIDGVIEKLTEGFSEALVTAAEGVHV